MITIRRNQCHSRISVNLPKRSMQLKRLEIIPTAFLYFTLPYGIVPHGLDHVGVQVHYRSEILGNTMMQHDLDGHPMSMHTNLGKPTSFVPAETSYVGAGRLQTFTGRICHG